MATHTVASDSIASHDNALVAGTADTVTFAMQLRTVEVLSDGSAAIYIRTDGAPAAVSDAHCWKLPAGSVSAIRVPVSWGQNAIVSLISSGTPVYSVTAVIDEA